MRTEALEAAYRATTYRLFLPGGAVNLRIGEANANLRDWLAQEGVQSWAILTAHNPASVPLPAPDNAERQSRLEVCLLERGFEPFAAENEADGGDWPVEESCFVMDIDANEAMVLARQFGQNALVLGGRDAVPHLAWTCDDEEDAKKNRPV